MAANVPAVVVPPPPARNPVDQPLSWIGFSTGGNRNSIYNEGGMEAFYDFFGLTERDILTQPLVSPIGPPLKDASTLGCGAYNITLASCTGHKMKASDLERRP